MNAIYLYRVAHFLYCLKIPIIPFFIKQIIFLIFNSVVPYQCVIGKFSKLAYGGIGVVIHSRAVLGDKVIIGQNVTIGRKLDPSGVPVIGNNVYISAGSRILGNLTIGDNVIIGANSVVISDVPSNSIVAGVPAKIIRSIDTDIYKELKNIY